ncbi:NADH-quinone oxidoreductase subunit F [Chloroflexota bacterium]
MPENRIVLRNCGVIDPTRISTYRDRGGFKALEKARNDMTPEAVIGEIKTSGLRGRGGAGFPCGLKWELARKAQGNVKYIIANADEGEVGTFKDRYILEKDPFTLIEAMGIAGYTIDSKRGYIYLRAEYHSLRELLANAISQAKRAGYLPHFEIEIREGAGAYICGEESALMDSIEGKRGEVRYRPPFPPQSGLWGKPTIINNIETLMNIPQIIQNGAKWFNQLGTENSKGTKVFSISGDVQKPGVHELIMGSTLRELVEGLALAKRTKVIQIGGATGRIMPYEMIDTPLTFETFLGAGAVTVFDQSRDVIDIVYRTMEFLNEESCGKCTPCREGTQVILEILSRLSRREGTEKDITNLQELSNVMSLASLCGLGQAAANPVLDSLKYFGSDYEDRICNVELGV